MRALFLASILIVPAAASADSPLRRPEKAAPVPTAAATAPRSEACQPPVMRETDLQTQAPRARSLGELPTGNLYLTVQREVDGCIEPVLVRQGYGPGAPRR